MINLSILLADDHAVVRQGLRSLLEREFGCVIVGEAVDGQTAIEMAAQLLPTILVVDIMLPGVNGLEVIRQVRKRAPQTRVVVLSMHAEAVYVREALHAGAVGYVLKEVPVSELLQAVREAVQGRRYLSRMLVDSLLDSHFQQSNASVDDPYELLTASERAVLALAAQGQTAAAIAKHLSLTTRTIETYRANLLHKLDLRNQAELVRYAIKRGIIPLE